MNTGAGTHFAKMHTSPTRTRRASEESGFLHPMNTPKALNIIARGKKTRVTRVISPPWVLVPACRRPSNSIDINRSSTEAESIRALPRPR